LKKIIFRLNSSILLLGSNLGDRQKNIFSALNQIFRVCGKIKKESSLYESEPWGFSEAENFYNIAILLETGFSASDLLYKILNIEKKLGRIRDKSNGYTSRIIDIDILFYNNAIINEHNLVIPHPLIQQRRFALLPVSEIIPKWIHPIFNLTAEELLINCPDKSRVTKIKLI